MRGSSRSLRSLAIKVLIVAVVAAVLFSVAGCKKQTVAGKVLGVAFSAAPDAIDVVGYKMVEILREQGVTVNVLYCDGGAKAVQALLAGQANISSNSLEDIANANLIAFALSRPRNLYAMVGKKGMRTVGDMRGKTLGAADPGSIANFIAEAIFAKHGIAREEVSWLQIGGSGARAQALLAGRVDAVFVYGGKHLMLEKEGYPTVTTMQDNFPGLHDDMWATTPQWVAANEDLAVAICKAQIEAARWFKEHPDEWLAMALEKVEGLEEDVARATYDMLLRMDMYPVDGLMTWQTLQATRDFFVQAGIIEDVPVEQLATMKYMDQAREELGIE